MFYFSMLDIPPYLLFSSNLINVLFLTVKLLIENSKYWTEKIFQNLCAFLQLYHELLSHYSFTPAALHIYYTFLI